MDLLNAKDYIDGLKDEPFYREEWPADLQVRETPEGWEKK
jgi:hypothetical protein